MCEHILSWPSKYVAKMPVPLAKIDQFETGLLKLVSIVADGSFVLIEK